MYLYILIPKRLSNFLSLCLSSLTLTVASVASLFWNKCSMPVMARNLFLSVMDTSVKHICQCHPYVAGLLGSVESPGNQRSPKVGFMCLGQLTGLSAAQLFDSYQDVRISQQNFGKSSYNTILWPLTTLYRGNKTAPH